MDDFAIRERAVEIAAKMVSAGTIPPAEVISYAWTIAQYIKDDVKKSG